MTQMDRRDSHDARIRSTRKARARRAYEGVVASYLRELSAASGATPGSRAERGLHA